VVFRGEIAAVEHRQLMDAALSRDSGAACKVLHTHIHDCVAHALRNSDWLRPASAAANAKRDVVRKPGARQ
jgi:DNA-binding GntR family transcriptional regulator